MSDHTTKQSNEGPGMSCDFGKYDVMNCLTRNTDNSKRYARSPRVRVNESHLYLSMGTNVFLCGKNILSWDTALYRVTTILYNLKVM